jgi:PAS domain S-box-containing protein
LTPTLNPVSVAAERTDPVRRLERAIRALGDATEPQQVVHLVLEEAREAVGARMAWLRRLAPDRQSLESVASVGVDPKVETKYGSLAMDAPYPLPYAVRTAQPVWVENREELVRRFPASATDLYESRHHAWAVLPMRSEGKILGALLLGFEQERSFSQRDQGYLVALAEAAGQALRRVELLREMRETKDRLNLVFNAVHDAVVAFDGTGRLAYANEAAARFLGYPSVDALVAAPLDELRTALDVFDEAGNPVPPERRPSAYAFQGQTPPPVVVRVRNRRTGREAWAEGTSQPVRDATGQVAYVVSVWRDLTEEKRAQASLREGEQRIRAIVEGTSDLVFIKDRDGRALFLNQAAARFFGRTEAELLGKLDNELFPEDVARAIRAQDEEVMRSGQAVTFEETVPVEGQPRVFLTTKAPYRDASGHIVGVLGLAREVTDRRRLHNERDEALLALRQSQAQYETLVHSIHGIVWEAEADTFRFTFVSSQAERILGYPVRAWTESATFWADHLHPEDRQAAIEFYRRCTHEGRGHEFEYRMIASDGRPIWLRDIVSVEETHQGTRLRGIMIDISAFKDAEHRRALYHQVFQASTDGIAIIDPQGKYIEQNNAHQRLTGFEDAQLVGQTPAIHLGEDTFQRIADDLARTGRFRGEVKSRTASGAVRDIELSAFTVHDDQGRVVCHVGIKRDLGPVRAAQRELQQSYEQLRAIYRLSDAVAKSSRLEDLYDTALTCIRETLASERASILTYDSQGVMRFRAWRGLSDDYRAAVEGHSPWPRDAVNPEPVLVPDVHDDASLAPYRSLFEREGIRALAFIPLVHQGQLVGKFMIYHARPHRFETSELDLARAVASHVAFAVAQHRVMEDLRSTEERFRLAAGASPEVMWDWDAGHDRVRWSPALMAVFGHAPPKDHSFEKAIAWWSDHVHPDDRERVRSSFRRALDAGAISWSEEYRFRRADGSYAEVVSRCHFSRDARGRLQLFVGFITDVSDRKRAERELAYQSQIARTIADNTASALFLLDGQGYPTYMNRAAERMTGYKLEEIRDRRLHYAIHGRRPDGTEYPMEKCPIERASAELRTLVMHDDLFHRKDASPLPVLVSVTPLEREGKNVGAVLEFRDMTERHQARRALEAHVRRQAAVAALGQLALTEADLDRLLQRATETVRETLAVDGACFVEARGETFLLRAGAGWRPGWVGSFQPPNTPTSVPGAVLRQEQPLHLSDLSKQPFEVPALLREHGVVSSVSVPVGGGSRAVAVMGAHSRTPRQFTREEIQFMESVANLVAAAYHRHRAEADLREANDRLRELDRLKTQFLNTVSHELRTPLTPIQLQLDVLEARPDADGTRQKAVQILDRNVRRLTRLVQDMVEVSRLQSGRFRVEKAPVDLRRLIQEGVDSYLEPARQVDVHLEFEGEAALPTSADPHRIGQVMSNLLSNALKFTPAGGRIEVSAHARDGNAVVSVRDTGTGLSADQIARLFQPFTQVHEESRAHGGTGLGLYISRGIVEAHGGKLWAESAGPGQGATFTFTLPLT